MNYKVIFERTETLIVQVNNVETEEQASNLALKYINNNENDLYVSDWDMKACKEGDYIDDGFEISSYENIFEDVVIDGSGKVISKR